MPCNQVTAITSIKVKSLQKVEDAIRGLGRTTLGRDLLTLSTRYNTAEMRRNSDGRLVFESGSNLQSMVVSAYSNATLIEAMRTIGFSLTDTHPMPADVQAEVGPGVEHVFYGPGEGERVIIGVADSGRLHFKTEGYSGWDADRAVKLVLDAMRREGLAVGDVNVRKDEKWFEERLPTIDREAE